MPAHWGISVPVPQGCIHVCSVHVSTCHTVYSPWETRCGMISPGESVESPRRVTPHLQLWEHASTTPARHSLPRSRLLENRPPTI